MALTDQVIAIEISATHLILLNIQMKSKRTVVRIVTKVIESRRIIIIIIIIYCD
jgi:hypothetical protein